MATPLLEAAAAQAVPGPAEAASESPGDIDISGALIDTGSSEALGLEQVNHLLQLHAWSLTDAGAEAESAGDSSSAEALELDLLTVQEARKAISKLTSEELRRDVTQAVAGYDDKDDAVVKVTLRVGGELLKSWSPDFWSKSFVDLFVRGDCRENDGNTRVHRTVGTHWTSPLMSQVDKARYRLHKEWKATCYKTFLRRDQINAVQILIKTDSKFRNEAHSLASLPTKDFLSLADSCKSRP